jgi:hypothetical protein
MAGKIRLLLFTEERQRAGGRRQKEQNIFALCHFLLKPLNLFMKRVKNFFETPRVKKKGVLL